MTAHQKQGTSWDGPTGKRCTWQALKDSLTENQVRSYFNLRLKTEVIVNASHVGLGGLLIQNGRVISYVSWAPSDVKCRYSQTQSKMLEVVRAAKQFHLYLYRSELVTVVNSHKPNSAHIDRWKLRLMPYNCQLINRPGKEAGNPGKFMSHQPSTTACIKPNAAEDYVPAPKAMTP